MIKLNKTKSPQILDDNQALWTSEYLSYINKNETPPDEVTYRYRHKDIKDALEKETYGKCAYCESKLKHIEFGDIEHILPKNKNARPDLYVNWNNLTIACEVCNRSNKKDYYNPQLPLINPYADDPEEFFLFLGPIITAKDNNKRAFVTDSTLDLNRDALVIQRNKRIDSINKLLFAWENASDQSVKNVLAKELVKECKEDKEYSAFVKHFLISKGFPFENLESN